jgi:disulfide oxidoreductase YuzD
MDGYDACKRINMNTGNEIKNLFHINNNSPNRADEEDFSNIIENQEYKCPLIVALSSLINEKVI